MNEMNVSKLSKRELERLSAYLDGELNARQTARVEARLEGDALFREALAELRQTTQWLRSMPQVTPPRRFSLTPEMVESRPADRAYPLLKLASAVAAAAFVFVVGIDAFRSTQGSKALPANLAQRSVAEAPAAADVEVAGEMAAEAPMEAEEEAAAPLAEPAEEAYEPEFAAEGEALQQTPLPELELSEIPAEETQGQPEMVPEESPEIGKTSEGVENLGDATADEETQVWGPPVQKVEPIRLLEIGLAILCIVLISTTLLLRVESR